MDAPLSLEPRLPLELLLIILEHSLDPQLDYSTLFANQSQLYAWSLVSRVFCTLAQAKLYATPCLNDARQADLFIRTLSEAGSTAGRGPELSSLVREVRMGIDDRSVRSLEPLENTNERVRQVVSLCGGLKGLWVCGATSGLELSALAGAEGEQC